VRNGEGQEQEQQEQEERQTFYEVYTYPITLRHTIQIFIIQKLMYNEEVKVIKPNYWT
jgi:hypothetical protein